jgi:hypothetical protein
MRLADSPRADALHSADESLALRSRASGSDTDHSRLLAAWLIHPTPQCIKLLKSNSRRARPRRVMTCIYSLGLRSPSRLSPSALCSRANLQSSCPSVRTPLLAPTLSTHFAVKPDVPNYEGLGYTEHMPGGLSACNSCQPPMFSRLKSLILCCGNDNIDWGLPGNWLGRYHLVFGRAS